MGIYCRLKLERIPIIAATLTWFATLDPDLVPPSAQLPELGPGEEMRDEGGKRGEKRASEASYWESTENERGEERREERKEGRRDRLIPDQLSCLNAVQMLL